MPYLTEDLITAHGTHRVFTDITAWRQARCSRQTIVLVEGRRRLENKKTAFLAEIEASSPSLRNGQKERVEVLDWRVLEGVLLAEESLAGGDYGGQRKTLGGHVVRELWRKHMVGLA